MYILTINPGSSSLKCSLYDMTDPVPTVAPLPLWQGQANWSERSGVAQLTVTTAQGTRQQTCAHSERGALLACVLESMWQDEPPVVQDAAAITLVGHRVVHGGGKYFSPTPITPEVKTTITQLAEYAPLHNPKSLEDIAVIEQMLPHATQVAMFDTAFHHTLPLAAAVYPIPFTWFEQGIRRYGFHGISHQYATGRAAQLLARDAGELDLITCHLGSGASLAAIHHGQSVDTTMGFTPLEGIMMGTRAGSVDPGILLYLMHHQGYSAERIEQMLNQTSGLLGVSGISGDMRAILKARGEGDERARLAFAVYIHRLRAAIGAYATTLGHIDALVFTGGIGEHLAEVRAAACETLGILGITLDAEKNQAASADQDIATSESPVRVFVIQAQENWAIAQGCWQIAQEGKTL